MLYASACLPHGSGIATLGPMLNSSRDRILEAATRVYAEQGFRGATTRRIAEEAGVNEITVFRHFGSKEALITEALRACAAAPPAVELPLLPLDPEAELTAWALGELTDLRAHRALIGRVMSEMGERPEIVETTSAGAIHAEHRLREYVERLRAHGFLADPRDARDARDQPELDHAAVSMLMSALFADAMWRDALPATCGVPAGLAPALYVRTFLRALGVERAAAGPGTPDRGAESPAAAGPNTRQPER